MRSPQPFVAGIQTPGGRYIYDVPTNGFFRVAPIVYDVLLESHELAKQGRRTELIRRYGQACAEAAWREIARQQALGVFLARRPARLRFPFSREQMADWLSNSISSLTLCIGEACNLRCSYCIYGGTFSSYRSHSYQKMSWAVAQKAIDLLLARSRHGSEIGIGFYGGEPLLHPQLVQKAADYARARYAGNLSFHLTTNGTLLRSRARDLVVRHRINLLVSLDGPASIHDASRATVKGAGTHAAILHNLLVLKDSDPDYYRSCVSFRATFRSLEDLGPMMEFFDSRPELFDGMPITVSSAKVPSNNASPSEINGSEQAWKTLTREYVRALIDGREPSPFLKALFHRDLMRIHQRRQAPMDDELYPNGICKPGGQRLYCTADGRLLLCERVEDGFEIGDVHRGIDLDEAMRLATEYAEVSTAQCRDCWAVRLCPLCFSQASKSSKGLVKDQSQCDVVRAQLKHMMSVYCAIGEARPAALASLNVYST